MPIEKVSSAQFADRIRTGILNRDRTWEVTVGEIPDLVINPQARVFERQNDRNRQVSLMLTLSDATAFSGEFEIDLEGIVFNEGVTRNLGAQAAATAVFSRNSAPTSDIRVQRGFPIATLPDEATGQTITFVTTEERTMFAASANSFFNIETQRYELSVPVVAVVEGSQGRVGARRINRPLRSLLGFDSVTNTSAAAGGRDRESNQEVIDRYLISILGRELATSTGAKKATEDDFPDVVDSLIVAGTNPLLTRAGDTAGAVDVYIIGDEVLEVTENPVFLGAGQLIQLSFSPAIEVLSVQDLAGPTTYIEDDDYEVVLDATGVSRSARAVDGIRFTFTGSNPLPTIGSPVTITYTYNNLIRRLQAQFELDDLEVHGRDLLFREGLEVPIVIDAQLRVEAGFNTTTVQSAVNTAVLDFVNSSLRLGDDVEESDIQAVVRQITGVDNFIFTRLTRSTVPSGVADIPIADNEHATLATADLTTTLI
jgi:uncharacterized phage protein gp47/JayE